jgi:hypothetical protein
MDGFNESFCALPTSWQRSSGIIMERNLPLDQLGISEAKAASASSHDKSSGDSNNLFSKR